MADYAKGVVYAIQCAVTGMTYIGSSVDLVARMKLHRSASNTCTSALVMECGMWVDFVLEPWPCATKYELERRERYHIIECRKALGGLCVNDRLPGQSKAERKAASNLGNKRYYRANLAVRKSVNKTNAAMVVVCGQCGESHARGNTTNHRRKCMARCCDSMNLIQVC